MLFHWMEKEGYVNGSVTREIRYPRKKDNISDKTITGGQLGILLDAHKRVQRPKIPKGQKRGLHVWFKPLVALGFYSGMRRGEIVRLTWDKVDLEGGFIGVTDTKPGRERVVPVQQNLMPCLAAWRRLCRRPSRGLVFCKARIGETQIPLNKDHVTHIFKKYVRAAGLLDTVNFHGLRHSCATFLLRKGMDISAVGKILGHGSPSTTKIYEHLNPKDIQNRMRELGL